MEPPGPSSEAVISLPKPRLLVVGGSGFIGSHVVRHAATLGWDVTGLGLTPRGSTEVSGVRWLNADISDREALALVLREAAYEYVVNCGGYINHALFSHGGRTVFESHFTGVLNVATLLNRKILRAMVNIGSSDEYGSSPAPQSEMQREAPISPYSLGKVAATHFLQMLYRTENFPAATLRIFLAYGPGQDDRRFLPQIISGCLAGRSFPVSEGQQVRDFCYIDDVVDAIFSALQTPEAQGEVINVGSGSPVRIRDVIESVRLLVGRGAPEYGKIPYRHGENMALYPDITKARALLNWQPKTTLAKGLEQTVRSIMTSK